MVACQIDVLPAQRREVRQQMAGDIFRLSPDAGGTFEVSNVPQYDRGDDEVEARSAVLLVVMGPVTDFAEPMNKHRPRQAVAGCSVPDRHAWATAPAHPARTATRAAAPVSGRAPVPLGQFQLYYAYRKSITGVVGAFGALMWNIRRA